jgi:hypothetical protein
LYAQNERVKAPDKPFENKGQGKISNLSSDKSLDEAYTPVEAGSHWLLPNSQIGKLKIFLTKNKKSINLLWEQARHPW